MRPSHFIAFLALFLCYGDLAAQQEYQLLFNWDKRRSRTHERVHQMVAASNGYIIAVGEALGTNLADTDGLFAVVEAETGKEVSRHLFGGSGWQCFYGVVQHPDGTFTLAGYQQSHAKAARAGWMVRLDLSGKVLFEQSLPGKDGADAVLEELAIDQNGSVLAAGRQTSRRSEDIWLVYADQAGLREQLLPTMGLGLLSGLATSPDGHFLLMGNTSALDRSHPADVWLLKLDQAGRNVWGAPKYVGDKGGQQGTAIASTADGGYILAGATTSRGAGMADYWLVKLTGNGDPLWERTFGGQADDVAAAVTELSEGGYAIFGHTWSNLPRAQYATLELILTDAAGAELDKNTYPIRQVAEQGNEQAHALIEIYTGDLVMAGSSNPQRSDAGAAAQIFAVSYKPIADLPRPDAAGKEPLYGTGPADLVRLSPAVFVDANQNKLLESGERGYMVVELTNTGTINLPNVSGRVEMANQPLGLEFWENIKLGTLRAGQKKRLVVPVAAGRSLAGGVYELRIAVDVNGTPAGTAAAKVESNQPDLPKLTADGRFIPEAPRPGETVTLEVRLVNLGGMPTQPMEARLRMPPGLNFFGSDAISIPALAPNGRHDASFSFSYDQHYPAKMLDFRLEGGPPQQSMLIRSFRLNIAPAATATTTPMPATEGFMAWVSHEPGKEPIDVNNREVQLKVVTISKNRLERDKFSILINGKRVQGQKMDEAELSPPGERNDQYYSNTVSLKEGLNQIQIVYSGEAAISSPVLTFNYSLKDRPNLYVLSIGVPYDDLKYTVKDAKDVADAYARLKDDRGTIFKEVNVYPILRREDATTFNIKKAFVELESMRRIKNGDLIVIFISSHGKITRDIEFILIPSDFQPNHLESITSINFETDILDRLRGMPGNKLVFIDACHSGMATSGSKNFGDAAASKVLNSLLQATAGLEIFASCSDHEYSYEDDSWGNSAFTKAIMEAFSNTPVEVDGKTIRADIYADNPVTGLKENGSDGVITIGELREFLQKRVPYLVKTVKKESQHPHNRSTDLLPENTGIYVVNGQD